MADHPIHHVNVIKLKCEILFYKEALKSLSWLYKNYVIMEMVNFLPQNVEICGKINKMCFCVKQLLLRLKSCSRFLKKKRYTCQNPEERRTCRISAEK